MFNSFLHIFMMLPGIIYAQTTEFSEEDNEVFVLEALPQRKIRMDSTTVLLSAGSVSLLSLSIITLCYCRRKTFAAAKVEERDNGDELSISNQNHQFQLGIASPTASDIDHETYLKLDMNSCHSVETARPRRLTLERIEEEEEEP